MKMKVLDYALLSLFSGIASSAWAPALADTPSVPPTRCSEAGCRNDEGLLFRLQSRGEREPVTVNTHERSGDATLQPDRRVSVELDGASTSAATPLPGKATATGKFSVQLPDGGVIWATEDPTLGLPELAVSAPALVPFESGRITQPVQVFVRSNYPGFIQRYELSFYRALDTARVEPLATLALPVAAVSRADWNGAMATRQPMRAGDELVYVLRAWGADGSVDETQPQAIRLVRPEDAERGETILRNSAEKSLGVALTSQQAQAQRLIDNVFTGNSLRQQNISIRGSRIRIQGRNLPPNHTLLINGDPYPVDLERKFVAEFLEPVGTHRFDLVLKNAQDRQVLAQALDIEVTGRYFFGIGIADLTVFQNKASGPGQGMALQGRTDDILSHGRLAFYGKAKLEGRYLVTAQADTQERDIRDLFSGFGKADARDVFRRVDPNAYYPTYGDDSTTFRDVDTQGRLYLRVDWDKNQALWGNYTTGITGTEYAQYVRSLYGAAVNWRSNATNSRGEPLSQVRAFASHAQTAPGHSELLGTGGSLYYLRHTDLLPGSDAVVVELRDTATGRVERRTTLQRGVDYEINELQGRILLSRPLAQVGSAGQTGITRDTPLAGQQQVLLVDYEWVPTGFDADQLTAGGRARHWVNDHLAIGGTRVQERRAGEDYSLQGADVTLQAGRGTYLKLERSQTQATSAPVHRSTNGGFSFVQPNAITGPREGAATAVDAQANLRELGVTNRAWNLGAWWRRVDAGYSVARNDTGLAVLEVGVQAQGEITDDVSALALRSRAERGTESLEQLQLTLEWRLGDRATLTGEVRRVTEQRVGGQAEGTLGAVQTTLRLTPQLELRGVAQATLDNDHGRYADNDAYTLGANYRFTDVATVGAEVTTGDRGDAARVSAEYRLSPEHTVYGSYTHLEGGAPYDPLFNPRQQGGFALGQRWRLSERVNLFNESQYLKEPQRSGLAHTFGMDFYPGLGWNLGFTLQDGELQGDAGTVQRRAASVAGGRTSPATDWRSKLEWREDSGTEQRTQWVTTHRINHRLDESWRLSARFNYADTQDARNPMASARFVEAGAGFAWRPHNDARYALLGRYTHLHDLATLGQAGGAAYDQKSHIVSLEGTYRWDRQWEYGAKLARREGQARFGRGTGPWFDAATTFAATQVRYELPEQWHALAEYRVLAVRNGGTRRGWMVGIDRDIAPSLRLGLGYNFTDFSDDLTRFDYRYRGFFINLVGSY